MTKPIQFRVAALAVFATASLADPARAQVVQSNGDNTMLPQPVGQAEIDLMFSFGFRTSLPVHNDFMGGNINPPVMYGEICRTVQIPGCPREFPVFDGNPGGDGGGGLPASPPGVNDAITFEGLFEWRGEQIDPRANARTSPGYFSPTCGFSGELVLRGGNCDLVFGWYNYDPNNPVKPADNEIYQLIPPPGMAGQTIEQYMQCRDQNGNIREAGAGFCPLAWDNHDPYKPATESWTPVSFSSGMISQDPNYKGGAVAFALIGKPNSQCTQTKYSIAEHNTIGPQSEPWITTLIWQSTVDPEGFYMAFEDLAMDPTDWRKAPPGQLSGNDGDFNDFVYFISGLSCEGGGQPCTTGLQGACSLGRTDCAAEGETPMCRPIVQPGAELCDNVDNDCDGVVDNGDGLCPTGYVCDMGACVNSCTSGEFPCPPGFACVSGACVEEACASVTCDAGQTCRGGACVDPCTGVTCPAGQTCQLGRCVDPCAGVTCPAERVCDGGLCVSKCPCRACPAGLECSPDGRCTDVACVGVDCPDGQSCVLGTCKDLCEGVVCPGGAVCTNGTCGDPSLGSGGGPGSGGSIGIGIGTGGGINFGGDTSSGGNGKNGATSRRAAQAPGCACRLSAERASSYAWLGLLLGAAYVGRRRARRKAA